MKRRKPGRPKVPESKALSRVYGARLRPKDEKLVESSIKRSGIKASDWIRAALVEKAKRDP